MYSSIVRVEETESLHWIGAGVECTKALRCWACMMGKYGSIPTRSCFVLLSTLSLGWRMARPRPSLLLKCLPYVAINLACSIQSHRLYTWPLGIISRSLRSTFGIGYVFSPARGLQQSLSHPVKQNNIWAPRCKPALPALHVTRRSSVAAHRLHTPRLFRLLPLSRNTTAK